MDISAFHELVRQGNEPRVRAALAQAPGLLTALNAEGRSAIHVAMEDNTTMTAPLLELGAPVDVVVAACLSRHLELRSLLERDTALARDRATGLSVLGWAAYYGAGESMALLLKYGADPNDGSLFCAAGVASVDSGRVLLQAGADPDKRGCDDGATAVHVASTMTYTDRALPFVELLASGGADMRARTTVGNYSALEIVRRTRQREEGTSRDTPARRKGFDELETYLQKFAS